MEFWETVTRGVLFKKVLLEISQNSQENTCTGDFFNEVADIRSATLLKKETLAQVFSCEFCEISKNAFYYRTPPVAAYEMDFTAIMFVQKTREPMQYRSEKQS